MVGRRTGGTMRDEDVAERNRERPPMVGRRTGGTMRDEDAAERNRERPEWEETDLSSDLR